MLTTYDLVMKERDNRSISKDTDWDFYQVENSKRIYLFVVSIFHTFSFRILFMWQVKHVLVSSEFHSFVHSLARLFVHLLTRSIIRWLAGSFARSFSLSFVHLCTVSCLCLKCSFLFLISFFAISKIPFVFHCFREDI